MQLHTELPHDHLATRLLAQWDNPFRMHEIFALNVKKLQDGIIFIIDNKNFLSVNDLHYCIPFCAVKCQPFSSNKQNKLCLFKELRHEIYQNSNSGNCREIE